MKGKKLVQATHAATRLAVIRNQKQRLHSLSEGKWIHSHICYPASVASLGNKRNWWTVLEDSRWKIPPGPLSINNLSTLWRRPLNLRGTEWRWADSCERCTRAAASASPRCSQVLDTLKPSARIPLCFSFLAAAAATTSKGEPELLPWQPHPNLEGGPLASVSARWVNYNAETKGKIKFKRKKKVVRQWALHLFKMAHLVSCNY